MKKVIAIICLLLSTSLSSSAQVKTSGYFDGYWSDWKTYINGKIHGNYDGFIIYVDNEGPWEYRFKFNIDLMRFPYKKQRKKDIKANKWYEFRGTVEYYVTNSHPSIADIFRAAKGVNFAPSKYKSGIPTKKITSKATIKIAPFKNRPKTYNIFFDNVAIAIDLENQYFPGQYFK